MDRKRKQVERYLRQIKHVRTREEEKRIEQEARTRRANQKRRAPRRRGGWDEVDEDALESFEKIETAPEGTAGARAGASLPSTPAAVGLVTWLGPRSARVRLEDGDEEEAALRHELHALQNPVVVGDEALLERLGDDSHRIYGVRPRRSVLSRPDPSRPDLERVLAANVDVGVLVVSVRQPDFRPRLIDRVLIALQRGGVVPVVCASKTDLLADDERPALEDALAVYRRLGATCLAVSSVTGESVPALREALVGKTCVFVGQSGVGKSSLLNAIEPGLGLKTAAVREGDGKGRHTTTASALFETDAGTRLIDTPGVRAFGLFELGRADLPAYFPELVALAAGCRFRDCAHVDEPACAVRQAAADGGLAPERYAAYLRLRDSLED